MAARWVPWILRPKRDLVWSLYFQGLAQAVGGAVKDQDLVICGDDCVPVGACGEAAGGLATWKGNRVWQGHAWFRRETHDKQGEDG